VCRAADLAPGRTKPIRIMSEDFTLYRGESGTPHIVAFRCAHRGTQLSAGWVQGDELRCYYHGWKYDATGQCTEQPAESAPFCERIRIRSVPTEEYIGLIFGYFGEGEPPPLPRYPELEHHDGLLENWYEEWPCNYFNRLENAGDHVHVPFVHYHGGAKLPMDLVAAETDWGFQVGEPGRPEAPGSGFHMPTMNHFYNSPKDKELEKGRRTAFMWRVPVDDEHHVVFGSQRVQVYGDDVPKYLERHREAERKAQEVPMLQEAMDVLNGKVTTAHIVETRWWDTYSVQDMVSLGVGQGPIADREHEHLGRSDASVVMLRQLYLRELRALAEGRPLKEWKHPED
jgi:5,5'-dehydrodivanillate O-demethylase